MEQESAGAARGGEHEHFVLRNRILLYLHGMEMGALPGMELASDIMREAGPGATLERAFDIMRERLRREGISFPRAHASESGLRCFPPFNRRSMLAAPVERLSLFNLAWKGLVWLAGVLTLRRILWDRRQP